MTYSYELFVFSQIQHIEEHFERGEDGASGLTTAEREAQRNREQQEFQMLRVIKILNTETIWVF